MFNGESLLQFPVAVAAAAILAAATGCLGFLGHDVGCNVLHLLSLLVQGKLLRVLDADNTNLHEFTRISLFEDKFRNIFVLLLVSEELRSRSADVVVP